VPFTRSETIRGTFVAESGSGPPIVFLHGNPDTHEVWGSTVARLGNFRCIAPDLPGFGDSEVGDHGVTLAGQSAWLDELTTALALEKFHLVCHDVGGVYGCAFAVEHSDRLQSLTIGNTIFSPDYRWHFWARVWRTRWLGELSQKILNRPLFVRELRRGSPRMPRAYAEQAYARINPRMMSQVLRWYRAMDPEVWRGWNDRLREVTARVPTQVLWGDLDPFIPPSQASTFGGEVHHFEDCGHWAMLEEPERFARKLGQLCAPM
jgi:pimeloyl-ACP methyl ester carboxylesterase